MEATEASARSHDPEEVQDLQDDHLIHRDEPGPEPEPEPEEEVLTNDIERDPPEKPKAQRAKRPRTKAQQDAFKKAQLALKAKREKMKEAKAAAPKKIRGRPVKREPETKKKKKSVNYN